MELRERKVSNGKNTIVKVRMLTTNTFNVPNSMLAAVHRSEFSFNFVIENNLTYFVKHLCNEPKDNLC